MPAHYRRNWATERSHFHWAIGGERHDGLFARTVLDERGRIVYDSTWGRVRLQPVEHD